MRTCVGCGGTDAKAHLIRFRLQGESGFEVVVHGPVRGRTAYVHRRTDCLRAFERSNRVDRSLRKRVPSAARAAFARRLAMSEFVVPNHDRVG